MNGRDRDVAVEHGPNRLGERLPTDHRIVRIEGLADDVLGVHAAVEIPLLGVHDAEPGGEDASDRFDRRCLLGRRHPVRPHHDPL